MELTALPQNPWLDLRGLLLTKEWEEGREGRARKGRREGRGPISEGRGRGGRKENGGRVSHPHVKTKLRSWSQHREQWRRGKRGGGGRRQVSK